MDDFEAAFATRQEYRKRAGIPTIAICGHGRAGKDAAAEYLGRRTQLVYGGSMSWAVAPRIARDLDLPLEEAWRRRHLMRHYWYEWCKEFRREDPSRLVRCVLSRWDLAVGLRDRDELYRCARDGLFDHLVWIERDVPPDLTLEYTRDEVVQLGGLVVDNNADLDALYATLERDVIERWNLPRRQDGVNEDCLVRGNCLAYEDSESTLKP